MNSPIQPLGGPLGSPSTTPPATAASMAELVSFIAEPSTGLDGLTIGAARVGPPPEVLDQIALAGEIEEMLRADGEQLHFPATAAGERIRIEVHDRQGALLRTLSVAEALEIASGTAAGSEEL
jgi:hypothetical protein